MLLLLICNCRHTGKNVPSGATNPPFEAGFYLIVDSVKTAFKYGPTIHRPYVERIQANHLDFVHNVYTFTMVSLEGDTLESGNMGIPYVRYELFSRGNSLYISVPSLNRYARIPYRMMDGLLCLKGDPSGRGRREVCYELILNHEEQTAILREIPDELEKDRKSEIFFSVIEREEATQFFEGLKQRRRVLSIDLDSPTSPPNMP